MNRVLLTFLFGLTLFLTPFCAQAMEDPESAIPFSSTVGEVRDAFNARIIDDTSRKPSRRYCIITLKDSFYFLDDDTPIFFQETPKKGILHVFVHDRGRKIFDPYDPQKVLMEELPKPGAFEVTLIRIK